MQVSTSLYESSSLDDFSLVEHDALRRNAATAPQRVDHTKQPVAPENYAPLLIQQLLEKEFKETEQMLAKQHLHLLDAIQRLCSSAVPKHGEARSASKRQSLQEKLATTKNKTTFPPEEPTLPGVPEPLSPPEHPPGMPRNNRVDTDTECTGHVSAIKRGSQLEDDVKAEPKPQLQRQKSVFADADAMKMKVREAVMKPEYSPLDDYHETGYAQAIAKSRHFENVTLLVIGINALWIAIETDLNTSPTLYQAEAWVQVCENGFCLYFTLEIIVRLFAFSKKRYALRDAWFIFDACLVVMMVLETWFLNYMIFFLQIDLNTLRNASIFRFVRMLRLTRMARMVRLLRVMPELMILIKGISAAARSVFFTLCLLLIIIYLFAICLVQLTEPYPTLKATYFNSVPEAMSSLLLRGILPDMADFVEGVGLESYILSFMLLVFILLSSLTVLNMLVGVLCEVVSVVSAVEKEQMTVRFVKNRMLELVDNSEESISRMEFEDLLCRPEAAKILHDVGVDVVGLVDFLDQLFPDQENDEVSFAEFMDFLLQLRSTNVATVKDIVDMRKFLSRVVFENSENTRRLVNEDLRTGIRVDVRYAVAAALASRSNQSAEVAQ
eukprot:TRINITY_DN66011_c0_g1_i1.p1 TRINITY_DN66011_c0_g1~~TRINITY_DN66011_c0_g1_i1.p1  ORF type:complete len:625 (-),score=83.43 TRINITY_DN66011_c0_g1_i1:257-2086(-)